MKSTEMRMYKT